MTFLMYLAASAEFRGTEPQLLATGPTILVLHQSREQFLTEHQRTGRWSPAGDDPRMPMPHLSERPEP